MHQMKRGKEHCIILLQIKKVISSLLILLVNKISKKIKTKIGILKILINKYLIMIKILLKNIIAKFFFVIAL